MLTHIKNDFGAYLDGTLPESRRRDVDAHLAACDRCRRAFHKERSRRAHLHREALKRASADTLHQLFQPGRKRSRYWVWGLWAGLGFGALYYWRGPILSVTRLEAPAAPEESSAMEFVAEIEPAPTPEPKPRLKPAPPPAPAAEAVAPQAPAPVRPAAPPPAEPPVPAGPINAPETPARAGAIQQPTGVDHAPSPQPLEP